jgi:hypothetical protein
VILFYTYTILKDLRQDEKEIEKILTRALVSADEIDDDDDSNEQ